MRSLDLCVYAVQGLEKNIVLFKKISMTLNYNTKIN